MKKILIIFTDLHLPYSPTTLKLFDELKKHYTVELLAAKPRTNYKRFNIDDPAIVFVDFDKIPSLLTRIWLFARRTFKKLFNSNFNKETKQTLSTIKTNAIINYLRGKKNYEIIAKDGLALWCAQKAGRKAHLLSLEIRDNYFDHVNFETILSVIIQSEERLNHLFPDKKPPVYLIQNAPNYVHFDPSATNRNPEDLIYCGNALTSFGFISCLDFIKDYKEYTLTAIGPMPQYTKTVIEQFYGDLVSEKRLIIKSDYLSEDDLFHFLTGYRIGFAFYDFYRFETVNNFNYLSAPSGKVFQYLNSGLPIIANRVPLLNFIEENNSVYYLTISVAYK